jgi:cytochrome c-type biogenesis protein CcmH/NrfG
MNQGNQVSKTASGWTPSQAYVMAVLCLVLGIAVGFLVRGSASARNQAVTGSPSAQAPGAMSAAVPQVTPEQLKQMADKQAEPLLQQLKANPDNAALLAGIGNLYYDAQQYADAVSYYERSLSIQPANTDVRTDMATAYWYLGQSDNAVSEFQKVLKTEPTKANALFNLGVVQWQGKMDAKAAANTWQKLLDSNPNYENRAKVQELLVQVRQHSGVKPGTKTDKPAL